MEITLEWETGKSWGCAGVEILENYQKSDAPPGGTRLAAQRQYSDVDACDYSGLEGYW